MEKTQREYYLNEQLKAIQKELGEIDEGKDELTSLSKSISDAKMPKLAREKCLSELKKLKDDLLKKLLTDENFKQFVIRKLADLQRHWCYSDSHPKLCMSVCLLHV